MLYRSTPQATKHGSNQSSFKQPQNHSSHYRGQSTITHRGDAYGCSKYNICLLSANRMGLLWFQTTELCSNKAKNIYWLFQNDPNSFSSRSYDLWSINIGFQRVMLMLISREHRFNTNIHDVIPSK